MGTFVTLISYVLLTNYLVLNAELVDPTLVDYYVELITKQEKQALEFEFPTDARMYEATDQKIRGKIWNKCMSGLFIGSESLESPGAYNAPRVESDKISTHSGLEC